MSDSLSGLTGKAYHAGLVMSVMGMGDDDIYGYTAYLQTLK